MSGMEWLYIWSTLTNALGSAGQLCCSPIRASNDVRVNRCGRVFAGGLDEDGVSMSTRVCFFLVYMDISFAVM